MGRDERRARAGGGKTRDARPLSRWVSLLGAAALFAILLFPTSEAQARESPWHLQVALGTDFPLHMGGHLSFEMPAGLQISTSMGHLLTSYVEVINAIAQGVDAYEQETADLVLASWRDAFVWRLHLGWRPVSTLGSAVSGRDLVTVLDDDLRALIDEQALEFSRYNVTSTLHMLDVELGWRWVLEDGWYFRVALGFAATLLGQTDIIPSGGLSESEQDKMISEGVSAHLNGIYRAHVHTPVISAALGIRFF